MVTRRFQIALPALLMLLAPGGCLLVTELDFEAIEDGTAAATESTGASTSSSGAGGDAATSSATSTSTTSATGDGGAGATTTSSAAGGAGGGDGGGACTFADAGPAGDVEPWSLTLGPFGAPGDYFVPNATAELDGDRVVFLALAIPGETPQPLLLDGVQVTDGTRSEFIVGWVDDGGLAGDAWPLLANRPVGGYGVTDLQPLGDGRVLVATASGTVGAMVIEVDLCTRAETPLVRCETGVADMRLDAADGRVAITLYAQSAPECELPPGCTMPEGVGIHDTAVFHIDRAGVCSSALLRGADESVTPLIQNGVAPALAEEDALVVVGVYDGALFDGVAAIDTGETAYYEDGPDEGSLPDYALSAFHRFHARLEVEGDALQVKDAVDLGRIAFAAGGHDVLWRGDSAFVYGGIEGSVQPTGPFASPLDPAPVPRGFLDVEIGSFPAPGAPTYVLWEGGGSADFPLSVRATDVAMMMAGWSTSSNGTVTGACDDPFLTSQNGAFEGGGCAFFNTVDDDGGFGVPWGVDAAEAGAVDLGYAAFALAGGDSLAVGVTGGTITLDRELAPPPAGFVQLYFTRVD